MQIIGEETDLRAFLRALDRAHIPYGMRDDHKVHVEHEDEDAAHGFRVTEWAFDADGNLTGVSLCDGEVG